MKIPRLLQICLSSSWGGLEMAALETAQGYARKGVFVRTVCPPDSPLLQRLKNADLPFSETQARRYFDPLCVTRLRSMIKTDSITTIILHQLADIWHARPALVGLEGTRLVGFAHIFLSVTKHDLLHQWLYQRMDALICLTKTQKENFAHALTIPSERIVVIPNGVDFNLFSPSKRSDETRKSLGASGADQVLIGVIGRLDQMKGQLEMVEAANILRDQMAAGRPSHEELPFRIALIGEDTLNLQGTRAKLEARLRELQLENIVCLPGFRQDIPEVIASLDVLAMPSYAETFGRVLIEAMASHTPVVASASGGVPEIIEDGVNGLLVPPRDAKALAAALLRYISNSELRNQIRHHAWATVQSRYNVEDVQTQMDAVLIS